MEILGLILLLGRVQWTSMRPAEENLSILEILVALEIRAPPRTTLENSRMLWVLPSKRRNLMTQRINLQGSPQLMVSEWPKDSNILKLIIRIQRVWRLEYYKAKEWASALLPILERPRAGLGCKLLRIISVVVRLSFIRGQPSLNRNWGSSKPWQKTVKCFKWWVKRRRATISNISPAMLRGIGSPMLSRIVASVLAHKDPAAPNQLNLKDRAKAISESMKLLEVRKILALLLGRISLWRIEDLIPLASDTACTTKRIQRTLREAFLPAFLLKRIRERAQTMTTA